MTVGAVERGQRGAPGQTARSAWRIETSLNPGAVLDIWLFVVRGAR
jgi:hypothetical protein